MDQSLKLKYQNYKLTVKQWEDEFMKQHCKIPSKSDIGKAPSSVRHAYKSYHSLKTELASAATSQPEIPPSVKETSKPSFSRNLSFQETSATKSSGTKSSSSFVPVFSNNGPSKEFLAKLSSLKTQVLNADDSSSLKTQVLNSDDSSGNVKGAWGSHLYSKPVADKTAVKHMRERTASFQFAEKLFSKSQFKSKRNPLKPHVPLRRSKSECFSLSSASTKDSEIQTPVSSQISEIQTPVSSQISEIQTPVSSQISEISQTSDVNDQIFSPENSRDSPLSFLSLNNCKVSIKDSTKPEVETKRLFSQTSSSSLDLGWISRCSEPPSKSFDFHTKVPANDPVPNNEPKLHNAPILEIKQNEPHVSSDDNEIISDSDTEAKLIQKTKMRLSSEKLIPTEPVKKRASTESLSPLKPVAKKLKVSGEKLSKQEVFEKKISEGKLNENFVKINLKKKIYVRGRKNTSYSKYKKMMYKKKQVGSGGFSTSKGACFTCGQAGHWSNKCTQAGTLLPENEAEQIDDSPFLTLEEAGALAEDTKPPTKFEPLCAPASSEEETVDSVVTPIDIQPVYPLSDNYLAETPLEVLQVLKKFGHNSFRAGQEEAVMRILSGLSTLVMLSTGAGKSLCYQIPAFIYSKRYPGSIALVISPLVSLMDDQVACLPVPLKGGCLHTSQTPKQRQLVEDQLKSGELQVLLVSPETIVQGEIKNLPSVSFVCIDEAHCVSQWSHNFRPAYLMLCKVLRERLKVKTFLGLTATATQVTSQSIASHLGVPDHKIISEMPMPTNLILSVSRDSQRDSALIKLLQGPRFSTCDSIIIYCIRREECDRLAGLLRTCLKDDSKKESAKRRALSWNAEAYHAGLSAFKRKQVQQAFMSGKLRIVVATVAFGMGINKNNLRAVIHYNMPSSFERFVQEVGRAGRDGQPAQCHLFLDSKGQDLNELRRHVYSDTTDRYILRKLLLRVFKPCKCHNVAENLENCDPNSSEIHKEGGENCLDETSETQKLVSEQKDSETLSDNPVSEKQASASEVNQVSVCPGHEIAFLTDEAVQSLDLPEENILTLLCFLELHPRRWLQVLSPVYVYCKVFSYSGTPALRAAAKKCPPLAMAVALDQKAGVSHEKSSSIEFKVVEVAAAIGWDSTQAKRQLKQLEWRKEGDRWRRSALSVKLSGLGLRVRAQGGLPTEVLDEALDWLTARVEKQENTKLYQLESLFLALTNVSYSSCDECLEEVETSKCEQLRASVHKYFSSTENSIGQLKLLPGVSSEDAVRADVSAMVCTYSDTNFTGRAIARIFHGIASPCFPAHIWGRTRYWRLHLHDCFTLLCSIASKELLRLRS